MNRKFLGLMFLAGVLICGFGCGIAFAQFSSFDYAGETIIGSGQTEQKTIVEDLNDKGEIHLGGMRRGDKFEVVEDAGVAVDEIAFDITYDPVFIDPLVDSDVYNYNEYYGDDNSVERVYDENSYEEFYIYGYTGDDVEYFFKAKDALLGDLKKKKIGSYEIQEISAVTVRINPANMDRVEY